MAVEAQTIATPEIKPLFAFDTDAQVLGTEHAAAQDYFDFGLVSFSMPYDSTGLEIAPNLSGHTTQVEKQGRHRRDLNTWTFDASFFGTVNAILANCLWAFGDGASACVLNGTSGIGNGTSKSMQMKVGASSANHTTAIFQGGGTDATANDLIVEGCVIQSMTIKEDVGANAGQMTCDSTFWTALAPKEAANTIAADTVDAGNAPKSIFDLTAAAITLGGQELVPLSWEITISRSLERIGSQTYADPFLPFAYVQTGAWEVTGSLNVKADDNTYDLSAYDSGNSALTGNSAGFGLTIAGTGLSISCPDVMVDNAALDQGGSFLTHTIPFRAFGATQDATVISITIS